MSKFCSALKETETDPRNWTKVGYFVDNIKSIYCPVYAYLSIDYLKLLYITVFKVWTKLGQKVEYVCNMSQFCPTLKDGPQPHPTENSFGDNKWTKSRQNLDKVWTTP